MQTDNLLHIDRLKEISEHLAISHHMVNELIDLLASNEPKPVKESIDLSITSTQLIVMDDSPVDDSPVDDSPVDDSPVDDSPVDEKIDFDLPVDIDNISWPMAVPDSAIVYNSAKKWARANTILTKFGTMRGPVLDFGCGEGHITIAIRDQGINCIGYDIRNDHTWDKIDQTNATFTTDWDTVVDHTPFKSILLHDVIDHLEDNTIEETMARIASILTEDGMVYIMAHPYSSRHGGHLYTTINKAYLHLLLSDEQIANNFTDIPFNQQIVKPQGKYQAILSEYFSIVDKKVITQPLEPWVVQNLAPLIQQRWYPELALHQVEKVMQISGIYYTLKKLSHTI